MPNIFAAYADTAYAVDRLGLVADLRPYLTDEELAEYVPGYLEEGAFSGEGTLKIFPIAKSVELLMLNATDWEKFAAATGADDSAFATVEGITETRANIMSGRTLKRRIFRTTERRFLAATRLPIT